MKNLKLGLFSLLAILAVSVFLTSCEQEDITLNDQIEQVTQLEHSNGILLPQDVVSQGEEAVNAYVASLTNEEVTEHANDYIIMNFLKEKGDLAQVDEELQTVGSFSDVDLSNYLSDEEVSELNKQIIPVQSSQINERGCWAVYTYYCCGNIYKFCCIVCF